MKLALARHAAILSVMLCWLSPAFADSIAAVIDGKSGRYKFLASAQKPWRICALIPHAKDPFFAAVGLGLVRQAADEKVQLGIYQAGGYEFPNEQRRQIKGCIAAHADAIVIAAINSEVLEEEKAELAARKIPVIDMLNGAESDIVAAHARQDFAMSGAMAARFAIRADRRAPLRVATFPGPPGAAWAIGFDKGMRETLAAGSEGGKVTLIEGGWGATDRDTQATLVRQLASQGPVDVIIANAVAAVVAARFYEGRKEAPRIFSYYPNGEAIEAIMQGKIAGMVGFSPLSEARISLDLAVRLLQGQKVPQLVSTRVTLVTRANITEFLKNEFGGGTGVRVPVLALPPYGE